MERWMCRQFQCDVYSKVVCRIELTVLRTIDIGSDNHCVICHSGTEENPQWVLGLLDFLCQDRTY